MTSDLIVRVASGVSKHAEMILPLGKQMKPLSLGTEGNWQIFGARVKKIHAFLHFDGASVSLLSTDEDEPARLNGSPIPRKWTKIPVPSIVTFGEVSILFGTTSDEPATKLHSFTELQDSIATAKAATERAVNRTSGLRQAPAPPRRDPTKRPPPPPSSPRLPTPSATVIVNESIRPAARTPTRPPGTVEPTVSSKKLRKRATIRRGLLVGASLLVAAASLAYFRNRSEQVAESTDDSTVARTAASSSVATSESTSRSIGDVPATANTPMADNLPASGGTKLPAENADVTPSAGGAAGDRSGEAAAADAVVRGDMSEALALYTALAEHNPEMPAFSTARDILHRKSQVRDGGQPR